MVIRFNCMMVRHDLGIVRLKDIGPMICVEYTTLKQSHVVKSISALLVRIVDWKHVVPGSIPSIGFRDKTGIML